MVIRIWMFTTVDTLRFSLYCQCIANSVKIKALSSVCFMKHLKSGYICPCTTCTFRHLYGSASSSTMARYAPKGDLLCRITPDQCTKISMTTRSGIRIQPKLSILNTLTLFTHLSTQADGLCSCGLKDFPSVVSAFLKPGMHRPATGACLVS